MVCEWLLWSIRCKSETGILRVRSRFSLILVSLFDSESMVAFDFGSEFCIYNVLDASQSNPLSYPEYACALERHSFKFWKLRGTLLCNQEMGYFFVTNLYWLQISGTEEFFSSSHLSLVCTSFYYLEKTVLSKLHFFHHGWESVRKSDIFSNIKTIRAHTCYQVRCYDGELL